MPVTLIDVLVIAGTESKGGKRTGKERGRRMERENEREKKNNPKHGNGGK